MRFDEAMKHLLVDNARVSRRKWDEYNFRYIGKKTFKTRYGEISFIFTNINLGGEFPFPFTNDDIFATDWYLVENDSNSNTDFFPNNYSGNDGNKVLIPN